MAQIPMGGGNNPAINIGHISGKVVDSAGKPVSSASIALLRSAMDTATKKMKETLVKAANASASGDFSFEELPLFGRYRLTISAVGFNPYQQDVSFMQMPGGGFKRDSTQKDAAQAASPQGAAPSGAPSQADRQAMMANMMKNAEKSLGSIQLISSAGQLDAVTVTSTSPTLKMDIDKKTFNVEKNIVTAGGTAVDVMRNVPSVQVDIDGNVKLRNASPQIYIDGRPTTLSLDQIPADAISSVEVITNPSAKFDASGGNAGILNLVLKKNKKQGYNGAIMAGVDRRGGYNFGGNFSLRQSKFNFTAAVNANHMQNRAKGTTDRYTFGNNPTHVYQNNLDKTAGTFIFGRLGVDYYLSGKTTLSLSGIKVHGEFKPNSSINSDSLMTNETKDLMNYNIRNTNGNREFNANGLQFGLVQNFKKQGHQLTADGNFFSGKNKSNSLYTTNYYDNTNNYTGAFIQQQIADGTNQFLTLQSDYSNPITDKTKIEAGVRAQLRRTTQNTANYNQNADGDFEKNGSATINYKNRDNVYAAYTTFTSAIKSFGYQVGLRAESSNYTGNIINTNQQFNNKYPISLFPSVFLSQKLKKDQELQLNYSRRVNRPNFFQLIPYTDSTDLSNITRGNPGLKPEFTNSFEASYSKSFKGGNSLLFSVYYKHTDDLITRFLDSSVNSAGKLYLINSYVNASSAYNYGAELTSVNNIAKWWDVTTNLNLYRSKINTSNLNVESQDALISWFGKLNNNFKLPKNFVIQLSADYQSKANLPVTQNQGQMGPPGMQAQSSSQGYIKPFWGVDVAFKKSFLKENKASVTLSFSDIFRTRANEQISQSDIFYQDYYRLNNPQMVRLNLSYRFGKFDMNMFKKQNKNTGASDAMQMGGQ